MISSTAPQWHKMSSKIKELIVWPVSVWTQQPKSVPLRPSRERAVSLDDIVEIRDKQHKHSVDVDFAEEGSWHINSGGNVDLGHLAKLALVASIDIPLDVLLNGGPSEAI
jgi:hypothetical protein